MKKNNKCLFDQKYTFYLKNPIKNENKIDEEKFNIDCKN
jgi:hypothetical protein